jgi:hypothetical protein
MDGIGQLQQPTTTSAAQIRVPSFVSFALLVFAGITVISVGVILAAYREVSNPFSMLGDLRDEDSRQVILAHGFRCREVDSRGRSQTRCILHDVDRTFSKLSVQVSDGYVNEIGFSLRENSFTLGDLVLLWGKPGIRRYCETVVAAWSTQHVIGIVTPERGGWITYFSPAISVYFTPDNVPPSLRILMNDTLHGCEENTVDAFR